jgi:precorrin-6B methylase 1
MRDLDQPGPIVPHAAAQRTAERVTVHAVPSSWQMHVAQQVGTSFHHTQSCSLGLSFRRHKTANNAIQPSVCLLVWHLAGS